MIRNKKLIQTISYNNFNYNPNKIKNKEHFFIKKDNEALFIKDMITLHIVNMLNQTHKHIRLYALKLSILSSSILIYLCPFILSIFKLIRSLYDNTPTLSLYCNFLFT